MRGIALYEPRQSCLARVGGFVGKRTLAAFHFAMRFALALRALRICGNAEPAKSTGFLRLHIDG